MVHRRGADLGPSAPSIVLWTTRSDSWGMWRTVERRRGGGARRTRCACGDVLCVGSLGDSGPEPARLGHGTTQCTGSERRPRATARATGCAQRRAQAPPVGALVVGALVVGALVDAPRRRMMAN